MKMGWIKARQTKYAAYLAAYLLVILAVLGLVNFLANRYNKSYDATANKQYTLSDETIKQVKRLNHRVTISYFGEESQFPQASDLLDRYSALSPNLKVEYVDPVKKPQLARAAGVRQLGTIIVDSGDRKEQAKSVTEEEITGALVRAIKGGQRTACFLKGNGEHSIDEAPGSTGGSFSVLKENLERNNYTTRTVPWTQGTPSAPNAAPVLGQVQPAKLEIPKDCSVVVSGGPTLAYSPAQVETLKAFVENGGAALFMLDTPLRIGQQEGSENPELVKMLAGWGVTMNNDLALDTSGVGQIFGLGPEVAIVTTYESQPIVRDFKEGVPTAVPLSRTITIGSNPKGTVEKLLATSDNSFATSSVTGPLDPRKGVRGPLVLAVAGTYNTGKPGNPGRFVVFGSSLWATNNILGSRQVADRDLAMNTFNWLSADEDLISIRPKEPEDRRLNITGNRMTMFFWWTVVVLPLTVIIAGISVLRHRR